jgi:hypothetical protein
MITKVEETKCSQKCVCNDLLSHSYSSLGIQGGCIILPTCSKCGSIEILYNNNADDEHSIRVTKIFAKVATQG